MDLLPPSTLNEPSFRPTACSMTKISVPIMHSPKSTLDSTPHMATPRSKHCSNIINSEGRRRHPFSCMVRSDLFLGQLRLMCIQGTAAFDDKRRSDQYPRDPLLPSATIMLQPLPVVRSPEGRGSAWIDNSNMTCLTGHGVCSGHKCS